MTTKSYHLTATDIRLTAANAAAAVPNMREIRDALNGLEASATEAQMAAFWQTVTARNLTGADLMNHIENSTILFSFANANNAKNEILADYASDEDGETLDPRADLQYC